SSMPFTALRTTSGSRRSPRVNSSAGGAANSCRLRSTTRTQHPSAFSRFTRCPPMKPPAPFTRTLFNVVVSCLLDHYAANGAAHLSREIPLDCDIPCVLPRFRHVVGELHAEKVIHVGAERLFDAQSHFRRQCGLGEENVGERGAAHLQNLRRLRHAKTE